MVRQDKYNDDEYVQFGTDRIVLFGINSNDNHARAMILALPPPDEQTVPVMIFGDRSNPSIVTTKLDLFEGQVFPMVVVLDSDNDSFIGFTHSANDTPQIIASSQIGFGIGVTFIGQTIANLGAVTTADINGGTIDGTTIGASSPSSGIFTRVDINDLLVQETNCIRKLITLTNLTDNTATEVFKVTVADEKGYYSCKVHGVVGDERNVNKSTSKAFLYIFTRTQADNEQRGANSAVLEVAETASAAEDAAVLDVGTITMSVTETSEFINTISFLVDITGTNSSSAQPDIAVMIELVYSGFSTPPVVAAA